MTSRIVAPLGLCLFALSSLAVSQTASRYRVLSVTFNTSNPSQLAIKRGRLVWRDRNPEDSSSFLKYYSGADILTLDTNLASFTAAIDRDHIVWNTAGELVKAFDTRSRETATLGLSYNPDGEQPVSAANGLVAFARRRGGGGTDIVMHDFASGTDTLFDAAAWNTSPSLDNGELAWVVSDSESPTSHSDIAFFDGTTMRAISGAPGMSNRSPVLRDGQVVWLQSGGVTSTVKLFTGDSVVTVAQPQTDQTVITGFDVSDGIAVATLEDTVSGAGAVRIYESESGHVTVLSDSNGPSHPRISNRLVAWQSGTGVDRSVSLYAVGIGSKGSYSGGENPVVGSDIAAWTSGDAVELYAPVEYEQLTSDAMNGWEQSKFKTIDSSRAVYGNFENSQQMRVYSWDGSSATQLTDSSNMLDFLMANDGYAIWRVEADSLYYYDGVHDPVKFLDTVQAENPIVAGGSIGFGGKRTSAAGDTARIWLYQIAQGKLTMITADDGFNGRVIPDGNTACWRSASTGALMFYNGAAISTLGDSMVDNDYSYARGKVVWIDRRSGIWELKLYDAGTGATSVLKADTAKKANPITDGDNVVWYENTVQSVTSVTGDLWFEGFSDRHPRQVGHGTYATTSWNCLSGGKIAWLQDDGSLVAYDGEVESRMMPNDGFQTYSGVYLDHDRIIWSRAIGQSTGKNGDIYVQRLLPHPDFQARGISGPAPLSVSFTNDSWEGAESYHWDFGDGQSSLEKNPQHVYAFPGTYSPVLIVNGRDGSATERKFDLIRAYNATATAQSHPPLPSTTALLQNFPNPFNPTSTIRYQLASAVHVALSVYDLLGRRVATIVNEIQQPGLHTIRFDGSRLASGVYFYALQAGATEITKKMILMK